MFKTKFILILVFLSLFPVFVFAAGYLNGALLRAEGDIKVYLIENNIKRWVSGIEVFDFNNFKWQDVKVVSKKEVASIKEGDSLVLESKNNQESESGGEATPSPISTPSASVPPVQAKVNPNFPPLDYIRADWLISDATVNYGRVGQRIIFKYSDKKKDKIENFNLYEKKPESEYFYKIAEFEEVLSTSCEDVDIDGEWMITEAGQCGYWAIQRIIPPGGRGMAAYLPASSYSVGEYAYYVAGEDKDGFETPPSGEAKLVFMDPISILKPVNGQSVSGIYPAFEWTIVSWPKDSGIDYFVMISDNDIAVNPSWLRQLKTSPGETIKKFEYDGSSLNQGAKYKVNIYGHYRASEYEPDYVSISINIPEFLVKKSTLSAVFKMFFGAIFNIFDF